MKITRDNIRQFILREIDILTFEGKKKKKRKKDPEAKSRNRGDVVFDDTDADVTDDEDHFPINTKKQAKAALSYASHYKKDPPWHKGSLKDLVGDVQRAVKRKYPSIKTTKASAKPGKG